MGMWQKGGNHCLPKPGVHWPTNLYVHKVSFSAVWARASPGATSAARACPFGGRTRPSENRRRRKGPCGEREGGRGLEGGGCHGGAATGSACLLEKAQPKLSKKLGFIWRSY